MDETQYVTKINGYYVKDSQARTDLETANGTIEALGDSLTSLENVVGDSESGLIKDFNDLNAQINDENTGIADKVSDLETDVTNLGTSVGTLSATVTSQGSSINTINGKLDVRGNTIKASLSEDYTIQTTQAIEPLDLGTVDMYNGSSLTLEAGTVKIGSGVHHVLVSGEVYWYDISTDVYHYKVARIYKNNNVVTTVNIDGIANALHTCLPAVSIAVSAGDEIGLRVTGQKDDIIKAYSQGTYLNVVVLD